MVDQQNGKVYIVETTIVYYRKWKEMKNEETINLNEGVKLVSFETKGGIFVYQDKKLVGILTEFSILEILKGE